MIKFWSFCFLITISCCLACQQQNKVKTPEGFRIEEGFDLTLVASEPLVRDPVDLEFNERGDALVLEMPGYPFEDRQSRLLVLKDHDLDGVFEEAKVFADNLQLASSILPYRKGVLVAAPPYLLFIQDDNQDYLPDRVDTLMGGFSTGNLQHNYNGLTYGLDNWIYAANGGNDGAPYWWPDSSAAMDLRGQDFRFNLDNKSLERLGESSGGFELAMDPFGRLFETHNLEHISHLVFPDRYLTSAILPGNTLENISDHEENSLSRIYPIGEQDTRVNHPEQSGYFSGACGITWYGGGALGESLEGTAWVADVVLNLVHVDRISPEGTSFRASRMTEKREFMASEDRSFRPVNMTAGPDGSMYVVDMYREVIEHPEWIPDEIEATMDLEAGKDKGRIYRISRDPLSVDLSLFQSDEGRVNALTHPNQWVRKTAHRLLMEEPLTSKTEDQLNSLLLGNSLLPRLHALYILGAQEKLSVNQLADAMNDTSPEIVEAALMLSEENLSDSSLFTDLVFPLLTHENIRVRMQAALSVSRVSFLNGWQLHANEKIRSSMVESASLPQDSWSVASLTLAADESSAFVFEEVIKHNGKNASEELLASLAANSGGSAQTIDLILTSLYNSEFPVSAMSRILQQLAGHSTPGNVNKELSGIRLFENSPEHTSLLDEMALLRNSLGLPASPEFIRYSKDALAKVTDNRQTDSVRLQQLGLISLLPYEQKKEVLFTCIRNDQPRALQEGALRQLANYRQKEIGRRIVEEWNTLSPTIRRYASDLLLYIDTHHDVLLSALEDGTINIGEMNFDLERRRMLLRWNDSEQTKERARALFSDAGVSNRTEAVEKMKGALGLEGSVVNGRKVFESICSTCHIYGEVGVEVGPVLTEINRKSKETLLHDILDPNAAADPKYINHLVKTSNGNILTGIIAAETDDYVTIQKVGGEKVTVQKNDMEEFRSLGSSLMMEGLENAMTQQDMADLLAFLQNGL